jgi:biotin carboxyl carrier protein
MPLRLKIRGDDEVHDRNPDERPPTPGPGLMVRPLAVRANDRASGRRCFAVTVDGWVFEISVEPLARAELRERAARNEGRSSAAGPQVVKAQIPGRIVRLWVSEGDIVESGQRLLAVEAMKMENEVRATRAGTVGSIRVAIESSVELGDELLTVN